MESQDSIAATSITSFDESEVRIDEGEDGIDGLPRYLTLSDHTGQGVIDSDVQEDYDEVGDGFWKSVLNLNGTKGSESKSKGTKDPPHGGIAKGLHVVQPIGSDVFIIEAGSGCIQTIAIGDEVMAMVQADDVHGTNRLDLVISTASGNIVTLESPAVPCSFDYLVIDAF